MRLCLLALLLSASLCSGANLLTNGGFELGPPTKAVVEGWTASGARPGVRVQRSATNPAAGRWCAVVAVEPPAPVAWYALRQDLPVSSSLGRRYTLSVLVRTQNVREGAGAYCSVACYDYAGKRLAFFDSERKVTGTTPWTRLTVTGRQVKGATRLQAVVVLHGYGEAFFDNAQLEVGDKATAFAPSPQDVAAVRRAAACRRQAETVLHRLGHARAPGRDVAILRDDFPSAPGQSAARVLADALRRGGFHVYFLTGEELTNPALLSPEHFDLLVLPYGPYYPAAARQSLVQFLAAGGHFFSTGGYAFDRPLVRYHGRWYEPKHLPHLPTTDDTRLTGFENVSPGDWMTNGPAAEKPRVAVDRTHARDDRPSLHVIVPRMHKWATASLAPDLSRAPRGWSVTKFKARGSAATTRLHVEWQERDGSRWKTTIDLTPHWQEVVLYPADFTYWPDNPSVGRGGNGDRFHPKNAAQVTFGVSVEILPDDKPYEFWITDFRVACDPLGEVRRQAVQSVLNTRTAKIRDAMWPEPDQIGVFDASHPLERAATARPATAQFIFPKDLRLTGPFTGWAAVAMLGLNGHGFGPNLRRLVPLMNSQDRFGRPRGALGALVFNYAGMYAHSNWAFFGVTNQDLFNAAHPRFLSALPKIAETLVRGRFLHDTAAQYACYHPGETVRLQTTVENRQAEPATFAVDFVIRDQASGKTVATVRKSVSVRAQASAQVTAAWRAAGPGDLYAVTASLIQEGRELDQETSGVVVWNDQVVKAGPRVAIRDGYFAIDGRVQFAFGTQNWWGQVGAVTARSPLLMDRDYRLMSDCGMRLSRCFLRFGAEEERRVSDAWVYLAQKHGIVLYHAPNLFNTASPEILRTQQQTAAEIAARYRNVPGLLIDISNEPYFVVRPDATELHAAFRTWLRRKYSTDAALQQAWGEPGAKLDAAALRLDETRWDSRAAADAFRFLAETQRTWAERNRAAFRAGRPDLNVSVGWSQGWAGGRVFKDPGWTCVNQDFTDDHYYGFPAQFVENVKMTDRRFAGKPWTLGECGGKNHPAYFGNPAWGQPQAEYNAKFAYLGHQAFGLGMAFMLSWHLRDPMEGIFPCGVIHADYARREALSVVRNMAVMFAGLQPRQRKLSLFVLLPDAHRHGVGRDALQAALKRLFRRLYGLQVDYGVLFEQDVDRLPASAKALLYPLPYCPPDHVIDALAGWVRAGGRLYVSGDLSYDPQRRRTRTDRLETLCGVRWLGDRFPNVQFAESKPTRVHPTAAATELSAYDGRPGLKLAPTTAAVLASCPDGPVITENALGRGRVFFIAEPLELEPEAAAARDVLALFLRRAGIVRAPVTPNGAGVYAHHVPLVDGGAAYVVLDDDGEVRWTTPHGALVFGLNKGRPGMVVMTLGGAVTLAEAQRQVRLGDRLLMKTTCHVAVMSLDRRDLHDSQSLLVLPFAETGRVEIPSRLAGGRFRAERGELHNGRWRALSPAPVRSENGRLVADFDAGSRLDLLLITTSAAHGEQLLREVVAPAR